MLCLGGAWQARREQTAWLLIGIGVLAWALGNLYYTVVLYDLEAPPIPSPADVGFLLFPVLAMAGVFALVRARTRDVPTTLWIDGAIAALAVTAVSAAIVFQTAFDNVSGKPVEVATTLAYPLADLILIGVAVGALSATGWRLDRTWVLLAAGIGDVLARRLALPRRVAAGHATVAGLVRHLLDASACCSSRSPRGSPPWSGGPPRRTACASSRPRSGSASVGLGMLIYGCLARPQPARGRRCRRSRWSR